MLLSSFVAMGNQGSGVGGGKLIGKGWLARLGSLHPGAFQRGLQPIDELALRRYESAARLDGIEPATPIDLGIGDPPTRSPRPFGAAFVGNDCACIRVALPGPRMHCLAGALADGA